MKLIAGAAGAVAGHDAGAHEVSRAAGRPRGAPDVPAPPARRPAPKKGPAVAPKPIDDVTLTRKVESVIFRDRTIPKGKVDVNVADGVVWLRGEVKHPRQMQQLVARARAIPQVRSVEDLLHLPEAPAPTRTTTPR
jgi:hypothetical protein